MRRLRFVVLIITCGIGSLFAGGEQDPAEAVSDEPITLSLWHYFAPGTNAIRWSIERWNAEHEMIRIEDRYIPFADLKREIVKAITTGEVPDIVIIDNPDHASFAASGAFADITERVRAWDAGDRYFAGPWKSTLFEGRNYGIPQNSNTIALFYNKNLFQQANLDPDRPPQTWQELRDYSERIMFNLENVSALAVSATRSEEGTFQFLPWLQMAGASFDDLRSDGAAQALTLWTQLYQAGAMPRAAINATQSEMMGIFAAQNTAMVITGPWDLFQLAEVDFEWGIALLPYHERTGIRSSALGGENFAIMAASPYIDEAWEYIAWTQRPDFLEQMYIEGGRLPSRGDIADSSDYWSGDPHMATFIEQLQYAAPRGPHPNWPQISNEIQLAIQKAMTGLMSPAEALDEAAHNIERQLN